MCGIVYVRRLDGKPASRTIEKRYKRQKDRGSNGFGYIALKGKDKEGGLCRTTEEKNILDALKQEKASEIIFHHRIPTSTPNMKDLNHPIRISLPDSQYLYWLVHNGIINNDDELKKKHDKLGIIYSTLCEKTTKTLNESISNIQFNDSETFGIELALTLEGKQKEIETKGNTAFIFLQTDEKGKPINLYYGRNNGNPLKFYQQKELITLCSEGQGELIEKEMLYCYNYQTEKTTMRVMKFGEATADTTYDYGCYGGYRYGGNDYFNRRAYRDAYSFEEEDDFVVASEMNDKQIDDYCTLTEKKGKIQRLIEKCYLGNCYEKDLQRLEKLEDALLIVEDKLKTYDRRYQMDL